MYLKINKQPLQGSEWIVHSEMVVQLIHQQQFKPQDDVRKLLPISLQIADKLSDGDVELLHLAGQVHTGEHQVAGVVVHEGVVDVEPLEVRQGGTLQYTQTVQ